MNLLLEWAFFVFRVDTKEFRVDPKEAGKNYRVPPLTKAPDKILYPYLDEVLLMSTHSVYFYEERRKVSVFLLKKKTPYLEKILPRVLSSKNQFYVYSSLRHLLWNGIIFCNSSWCQVHHMTPSFLFHRAKSALPGTPLPSNPSWSTVG